MEFIEILIYVFGGYLIGVAAAFAIIRPGKEWEKGYNTAKEFYGDFKRGFDSGFKAGWNSAIDASRRD